MKDDVLYHIFKYATFVWPLRWKSWKGNDGIPYINVHAKFYEVSMHGSVDRDEKS